MPYHLAMAPVFGHLTFGQTLASLTKSSRNSHCCERLDFIRSSDSDGNWTRVTAVKGRCLNLLTTEPNAFLLYWTFDFWSNSPSWVWTNDPPVNSRMLYRWAIEDYVDAFLNPQKTRIKKTYQHYDLTKVKSSMSWRLLFPQNRTLNPNTYWLSFRPISNHQLNMSPCLHLGPIYLVVFKGS